MSISEVSSQSTLLSLSYIGVDRSNGSGSESIIERYREKYRDRRFIYEDWLKQAKTTVTEISKEIDSKLIENRAQQKTTAELYATIKESHQLFQNSMSCFRQAKKRKFAEVEI